MRIIGGKFRGKRLFSPKDDNVRPTTDRVKETIFNILTSRSAVDGADVLDLFCGSGALGIEALSRGATSAVFVDKSPDSIKLARQNLAALGLSDPVARTYNTDYAVAVKKLDGCKFDLIFLDAPYFDNLEGKCLLLIEKYGILDRNGVIVLEHSDKTRLSAEAERYIIDERKCGSVCVSFLTLPPQNAESSVTTSGAETVASGM